MFEAPAGPTVSITKHNGKWIVETNINGQVQTFGPFTSQETASLVHKQENERIAALKK